MLTAPGEGRARRAVGACLGALAMLWLAGCGSASEESAHDAADRFVSALGSGDAGQACELLAPDTVSVLESLRPEGCQQALPSLDLSGDQVTEVRVWGDAAQARSAKDVLFLRELSDGWRVIAAGCQPRGESEPYECELGGS